jgi:hypothetical protein
MTRSKLPEAPGERLLQCQRWGVCDVGTADICAVDRKTVQRFQHTAVLALAWHMLYLLAAECKWDHLVRPSNAPRRLRAPTAAITVMSTTSGFKTRGWWLSTAWYGLQQWSSIRYRVRAWQSALTHSRLPQRFCLALCNDLFHDLEGYEPNFGYPKKFML